jgi:hypothetical protein
MDKDFDGFIFPIAKRIFATTIAQDLVEVKPLGGANSGDEIKKIKSDLKAENRDRKIESLVDDKEFKEMKIEEHPDYKATEPPRATLMYMDMVYKSDNDEN